ncbi:MAG: hypothetical protein JJ850_16000 [Kordiimonadaceae bacterium]|nr:hypothetical protein [Kordiimonadaceae bacterium]MBO6569591.1 hypothetical protein [Kordiimonadaceae bacterium]MBO6966126.1 hypothetical protein [Kordiimonadaceae bacterium]
MTRTDESEKQQNLKVRNNTWQSFLVLLSYLFLIGAVLYNAYLFREAGDQRLMWIGYSAAIGVTVAMLNAVLGNFRIREQMKLQVALNREANRRQQQEWDKRQKETLEELSRDATKKQERISALCDGLIMELDCVAYDTRKLAKMDATKFTRSQWYIVFDECVTTPCRPVFDNLGQSIGDLPPQVVGAISRQQSSYQHAVDEFAACVQDRNHSYERRVAISNRANRLRKTSIAYMEALEESRRSAMNAG